MRSAPLLATAIAFLAAVSLLASAAIALGAVGEALTTPDDTTAEPPSLVALPEPSPHLAGRTIVVDPGHGGLETGAIGWSGTIEKNNTLATALILRDLLEKQGVRVIMTRTDDAVNPEPVREVLKARAALANDSQAEAYVSIHNDWDPKSAVVGTSTWYYREDSRDLAGSVQRSLLAELGTRNRGVNRAPFVVVKETTMPAILVEIGFLSNPAEERLLGQTEYQTRAAQAIVAGLVDYFEARQELTSWEQSR